MKIDNYKTQKYFPLIGIFLWCIAVASTATWYKESDGFFAGIFMIFVCVVIPFYVAMNVKDE